MIQMPVVAHVRRKHVRSRRMGRPVAMPVGLLDLRADFDCLKLILLGAIQLARRWL